jgi:hypothetical protein
VGTCRCEGGYLQPCRDDASCNGDRLSCKNGACAPAACP